MLTYDDTDEEQYSIAFKEMNKYGFKGVYFIMTIAINRPRYMSKEQIKELSDSGNVIADLDQKYQKGKRQGYAHDA